MSCERVDDHWGHLGRGDWRYPPYTPGSYDWAIPWTKEELRKRSEVWDKFMRSMGARPVKMEMIQNELVEMKPMDLPSGLLFYVDWICPTGSGSPTP